MWALRVYKLATLPFSLPFVFVVEDVISLFSALVPLP